MEPQTWDEFVQQIKHHQEQAALHMERVAELTAQFDKIAPPTLGGSGITRQRIPHKVKAIRTWVKWLSENQPALRKDITAATGVNLTANATHHVLSWKPHMEDWEADTLPGDTLMNISAPTTGMGRPSHIYFLWSQRFDLLPLFEVGPVADQVRTDTTWDDYQVPTTPETAPEPSESPSEGSDPLLASEAPPEPAEPPSDGVGALLGVVLPPETLADEDKTPYVIDEMGAKQYIIPGILDYDPLTAPTADD